ncbi:galanin receptor type 1-like [Tiliqua scincoides]|uniref:galanin receptor type 1-like n=1 Tax=Tiliqua scincoides TaxID=71010 RepID=UPI003461B446
MARSETFLACNCSSILLPEDGTLYGLSRVSSVSIRYSLAVCLSFVLLMGLAGNFLMFLVLADSLRGSPSDISVITSLLMLNVSVFDMVFLFYDVSVMLFAFISEDWQLGETVCISSQSISTWAMCCGFYSMVATSVLRYLVVVHPTHSFSCTPCLRLLLLSCTWILGFVISIPNWMHQKLVTFGGHQHCVFCMTQPQILLYFAVFFGVAFLPFLLLMVGCYWEIIWFLWCRGDRAIHAESFLQKNRQVTSKILTIVVIFVVMWIPYWVMTFLLANHSLPPNPVVFVILNLAVLLAYSNCCVSPLIFFGFSDRTRLQLKKIFRLKFHRNDVGRSQTCRIEIAVRATSE